MKMLPNLSEKLRGIFHSTTPSNSPHLDDTFLGTLELKTSPGRHGDLKVSDLTSGLSCLSSSPGWGVCIVFLGKTLYSHSAPHPGM